MHFCNFDPPFLSEDGLNRKTIYLFQKTSAIGLSQYVKIKVLSPLSLPEKIRLLFVLFGLFLAGNRARSLFKESESKFDISYFTHTIPDQLPVEMFCASTFQFYGYKSQKTFQKDLNRHFQFWLLFLIPRLHFSKKISWIA